MLSEKTKLNSILFFLISGVIAGPKCLGLFSNVSVTEYFGNIGVIFLLFTVGLHLPLEKLKMIKKYVFVFGPVQTVLTTLCYQIILFTFFNYNFISSLFLGLAISLSSTAIILQILNKNDDLGTEYGKISFGILLFQDFAVILAFAILPVLYPDSNSTLIGSMLSLAKAFFAVAILIYIGKYLIKPVFNWAAKTGTDVFMSITFLSVFSTAYITNLFGISMELGAFLAGLLLAGSEYRIQVEADIEPFKGTLLGLFFLSVGMTIDPVCIIQEFKDIIKCSTIIVSVKIFALLVTSLILKSGLNAAIKTSFTLAGCSEFAFVLLSPAIEHNIVPSYTKEIYFSSISLLMLLTPFLIILGQFIANQIDKLRLQNSAPETLVHSNKNLSNHVIIAGFGRVGKTIAALLSRHFIPFIAIDSNMNKVTNARKKGLPVFYGDAKRSEIYRLLGANSSRLIIVVLGKPDNSIKAASMLLKNFPNLNVWMRLNDSEQKDKLEMLGANIVIPQLLEPSLQLGAAVLKNLGISEEEAKKTVDSIRENKNNL